MCDLPRHTTSHMQPRARIDDKRSRSVCKSWGSAGPAPAVLWRARIQKSMVSTGRSFRQEITCGRAAGRRPAREVSSPPGGLQALDLTRTAGCLHRRSPCALPQLSLPPAQGTLSSSSAQTTAHYSDARPVAVVLSHRRRVVHERRESCKGDLAWPYSVCQLSADAPQSFIPVPDFCGHSGSA